MVTMVKIKNRSDCCGERLAKTLVKIGGQQCGKTPSNTKTGQWIVVKCKTPLKGLDIKLETTKKTYLHFEDILVFAEEQASTIPTLEDFDEQFKNRGDNVQCGRTMEDFEDPIHQ